MHTDPIADMITRIKNAAQASKESVDIPASRMKIDILDILMKEGYIKGFKVIDDGKQGLIRVNLKYYNAKHVITGMRKISKPGRRIYRRVKDIQQVRRGLGVSIVSTSQGIMTDHKAKANNVGGEEILRVW
ncbi:MAG TPA: 30S ribosomal protein S8 [Deltaproteobacteria bacterium]|jgi:small subunit ribosomal protein S8|nr:30S ribosomal protein S8 [Deltaproteobacteria bacterium]MDI9541387.1 30S ribosomal protein S8 [Pseudomonadota bacterium]HRR22561.1 30S ribosomal protein S8 [Desulfomonilia bacterium]HOD70530.1 30S ribosomal protein S8 [Deltaproteobacteria bacterium]HOE74093.1 30S ribosomal protein S8 [Deltaproteobacteria bacterium]